MEKIRTIEPGQLTARRAALLAANSGTRDGWKSFPPAYPRNGLYLFAFRRARHNRNLRASK